MQRGKNRFDASGLIRLVQPMKWNPWFASVFGSCSERPRGGQMCGHEYSCSCLAHGGQSDDRQSWRAMRNARREGRFSIAVLLSLVSSAALGAMVPGASAAQAQGYTQREEIELGRRVSRDAEARFGGVMPARSRMARRVRRIGMAFGRLSSRRDIPYSYHVLNDRTILNAFAVPGGPVYITRKLVETTNDAELAYILGHETAHIDRRHTAQTMEKFKRVQNMTTAGGHYIASGSGRLMLQVASGVALAVWSIRYSRTLETEADLTGVRWMSRLGYDPRAAVQILQKVAVMRHTPKSDPYLSTHPAIPDREARILLLIRDEKLMEIARRNGGPRLQEPNATRKARSKHKARTTHRLRLKRKARVAFSLPLISRRHFA